MLQLGSSTQSRLEKIMACCRSTYHIRKVTNKGAIVVLVRNLLAITLLTYINENQKWFYEKACFITWGITVPVIGWLADVRLGRHKVIQWSMWIMWAGFILATASSVVAQLVDSYNLIHEKISSVLVIVAAVGFGGYQANVIQFGIDQLHDASTDEITSFICWYVWTSFSGGAVVPLIIMCAHKDYQILTDLAVCICLSIALGISLLAKKHLIKEPLTQNPFKLVYNVLKYAIKTKHPRCRSAFTYCEDELPSRIDFGKSKYGGPFTTEQVEDVKTFLRLILVIFLASPMPSFGFVISEFHVYVVDVFYIRIPDTPNMTSYLYKFNANMTFYSAVLLIPLYEFIIYPVFRRHFSCVKVKIHLKFLLGVLFQISRVISLMVIITLARHSYQKQNDYNVTIPCIMLEQGNSLRYDINSGWLALPRVLNSLSVMTLAIGTIEFIAAQTPYSMRGLIGGTVYGSIALFVVIGYGIMQPFMGHASTWGTGLLSCGFWYLLMNLILILFIGAMLSIAWRWYKMRKREDVLPNEQIFAERYYARS